MIERKINFVTVGGYGYCGGSAAKDLLKEFIGYKDIGTEFRLIKDPYGLMDLRNLLARNWRNSLNSDIAIKDYIWLIKSLSSKCISGFSYKQRISKDIMNITNNYINSLVDYSYPGSWHLLNFKKMRMNQIYNRLLRKLNITKFELIFYSKPTDEMFIEKTKEYLDELFTEFCEVNKTKTVILHNAVDTYDAKSGLDLFNSIKMIIVDRDPRDVYVDIVTKKSAVHPYEDFNAGVSIDRFIDDYKARRENYEEVTSDDRILKIRFEDLVLDYNKTIDEIMMFLEMDKKHHVYKMKYFNPNISKRNVGIWKSFERVNDIKLINEKLSDYCNRSELLD